MENKMDKRRYEIGDLIDNKYGPELEILGIDDDSGKTDSCYKTTCTKCGYIIERTSDFLEKMKICPGCEEKPPAVKTDDDGMSTVEQNNVSNKDKTDPKEKADLHGEGGDAMQIIESGSNKIEKLPGAVDKHTPDNKTSDHNSNTNLKEDCTMREPQKPDIRTMLTNAAIKPGSIPQIKFETKQAVLKASGSTPPNTFFRVHPDYEMVFQMVLSGREMDSKMYIIGPDVTMPAHLRESIKHVVCHLIVFPDGDLRILERKTACPGELPNEYQMSSLNVIEAAKKGWVMRRWVKSAGVYEYAVAAAEYAPEPSWPEDDFMELLIKAYEGRIIDSVDHPIYLELAGTKAVTD
jgi:hypothetical protein